MGGTAFEWIGILLGCAGLLVGLKPDIVSGLRRRSLRKSLKSLKKLTDLYAKRRNFVELAEKKPVAATANLIRLTASAILFAAITAFFSYSIPDNFNIILGMTALFFCVKFINEVAVHALDLKEPERLKKISSDIRKMIEKSSGHLDKMSEKDKKLYEEIKTKFRYGEPDSIDAYCLDLS